MNLTNRELRGVIALLNRPLMREEFDVACCSSNGPDVVMHLREKGLGLPCHRIKKIDVDGKVCCPGRYELTKEDELIVREWLED